MRDKNIKNKEFNEYQEISKMVDKAYSELKNLALKMKRKGEPPFSFHLPKS